MDKWIPRITIGILIVGGLVIAGLLLFPGKQPIPGSIKSQLSSTLLAPTAAGYTGSHDTAKYDSSHKLLAFKVTIPGGHSVTVSESPSPSQFTDITGYFNQFINDLGEYENFGTVNGTVYLTHPKNAPQTQVAVLNTDGTLMFVKPDNNISDDQWHAFFNAIQAIR